MMKTLWLVVSLLMLPAILFAGRKPSSLVKTPKSLFLIKKAKITSDVGEPLFYPAETQLRTITNDPLLHNTKKFE